MICLNSAAYVLVCSQLEVLSVYKYGHPVIANMGRNAIQCLHL